MQPDYAQFAGNYTQIPLDPNALLIPYGDLRAQAAYGRGLILPDDLVPTLSLLTLIGSKNGAKLTTGKHVDGAVDVYQVNAGGSGLGSGSTGTYLDSWGHGFVGSLGVGSHDLDLGSPTPRIVVGYDVTLAYISGAAAGGSSIALALESKDESAGNEVYFASTMFFAADAVGMRYHSSGLFYPSIDVPSTFTLNDDLVLDVTCNCTVAIAFAITAAS